MSSEISFCPQCAGKLDSEKGERFVCDDCETRFLIQIIDEEDDEEDEEEDADDEDEEEEDADEKTSSDIPWSKLPSHAFGRNLMA